MPRIAFQTAMRAGAVSLLQAYKADVLTTNTAYTLQIYPGRPRSINPPTAFVDRFSEALSYTGLTQREPRLDVVVIHGSIDSAETVAQRDAFVDGFIDWALDNVHAAHANTTMTVDAVEDDPTYVPDWLEPQYQRVYYASVITLGGLALTG